MKSKTFLIFFGLLLLAWTSSASRAADTLPSLTVKLKDSGHEIRFLKLPPHPNIFPITRGSTEDTNNAQNDTDQTDVSDAYEIKELYLAETELSLRDLKMLISDKSWEQYKTDLLNNLGEGNDKPQLAAYKTSLPDAPRDFPAICVDLPLLKEITESLNKADVQYRSPMDTTLVESFFRPPSRREWQYAARCISSPDKLASTQHFPSWLDSPDSDAEFKNEVLVDYNSIREALNKDPLQGTPSQHNFVNDINEYWSERDGESVRGDGYNLLGRVLQATHKLPYDPSQSTSYGLYSLTSAPTNRWGYYGMVGNAGELALGSESCVIADSFWERVKARPKSELRNSDNPFGYSMGGTALDKCCYKNAWKEYSAAFGHGPERVRDIFFRTYDTEPELGEWSSVGPFFGDNASETEFGPEATTFDQEQTFKSEDEEIGWKLRRDLSPDKEMHRYSPGNYSATYYHRTITVTAPQEVRLQLGCDDGIRAWLNSEEIEFHDPTPDQTLLWTKKKEQLKKGQNELLVKLTNQEGPRDFYFKNSIQYESKFKEHKAGIRLLLRRRIAPSWFLTFRKAVLSDKDSNETEKNMYPVFEAVCTRSELIEKQEHFAFYKRLHAKQSELQNVIDKDEHWYRKIDDADLKAEAEWWGSTIPLLNRLVDSHLPESEKIKRRKLAALKRKQAEKKKEEVDSTKGGNDEFSEFRRRRKSKRRPVKVDYFTLLAEMSNAR